MFRELNCVVTSKKQDAFEQKNFLKWELTFSWDKCYTDLLEVTLTNRNPSKTHRQFRKREYILRNVNIGPSLFQQLF